MLEAEWFPSKTEYDPKITKEKWIDILSDKDITQDNCLHILACFYESGYKGTCTQLEKKYNDKEESYNLTLVKYAERIINSGYCLAPDNLGKSFRRLPVLFIGKNANKDIEGSWILKLRDELKDALTEFGIEDWNINYLLKKLLVKYKILIKKTNYTEFLTDELYKWEFVTSNYEKPALTIVKNLINENINLFDRARTIPGWKQLLQDKPEEFKKTIDNLLNEKTSLHTRLQEFKKDMDLLFAEYKEFNNHANDERTAACFLICSNHQKYTIYKDIGLYDPLCVYLGIEKKSAGNKYEHFLELARKLADIVHNDFELQNIFQEHTKNFIQSDLLIAQTIIWCVFSEDGKALLCKTVTDRKYWSGGFKWGQEDKYDEFVKNNYWQIGWSKTDDTKGAVQAWQNIESISVGDYLAFHTYGGRNDLTIHYLAEVTLVDTKNGLLNIKKIPDNEYYKGKGPNMYPNTWFGTLIPVTGAEAIKKIFHIESEEKRMNKPEKLIEYTELLKNKKNIILQGAPGTGKTYTTASLALSICGIEDIDYSDRKSVKIKYDELCKSGQIGFCTFHQSMDYEDFIEGLRPQPTDNGVVYQVKPGIFRKICKKAQDNYENSKKMPDELQQEQSWENTLDKILDQEINIPKEKKIQFETKNGTKFYIEDSTETSVIVSIPDNGKVKSLPISIAEILELMQKNIQLENVKDVREYFGRKFAMQNDSYTFTIVKFLRKQKSADGLESFQQEKGKNYVLIIDEINRGYISKIFGELITLIEKDKRIGNPETEIKLELPYSGISFGVPQNLYIIGTMNTTDRSTGTIDYAVRRRFAFVTLEADESVINDDVPEARLLFADIKKFIEDKKISDIDISDLMVGHSYFMAKNDLELMQKMKYEIIPLIKEYIKDGIINCLPSEAQEYFEDWVQLKMHQKNNNSEELNEQQ